jgi:hypothetical protein
MVQDQDLTVLKRMVVVVEELAEVPAEMVQDQEEVNNK